MDAADLELFARSLRQATETTDAEALDAALDELGWADALADDRRAAVSVLFDLQGAANVTSSALDRLVNDALGAATGGRAAVVLPRLGGWSPPAELDGDRVRVAGLGTAALTGSPQAIVVASAGGKDVAVVVPTAGLRCRRVEGIDPSLGLVEVSGEIVSGGQPEPVGGWGSAVTLAHLAIGHELVGASRKMLDLARVHALERIQFGRPISQFQAIRHRLAETLVAVEGAEAALDGAWRDGSSHSAAMAKAVAGRGARVAARHCQQVLAGVGFTTEHPFHRYLRRVVVLDQLFGSTRALTRQLGAEVLAGGRLPGLLPL